MQIKFKSRYCVSASGGYHDVNTLLFAQMYTPFFIGSHETTASKIFGESGKIPKSFTSGLIVQNKDAQDLRLILAGGDV